MRISPRMTTQRRRWRAAGWWSWMKVSSPDRWLKNIIIVKNCQLSAGIGGKGGKGREGIDLHRGMQPGPPYRRKLLICRASQLLHQPVAQGRLMNMAISVQNGAHIEPNGEAKLASHLASIGLKLSHINANTAEARDNHWFGRKREAVLRRDDIMHASLSPMKRRDIYFWCLYRYMTRERDFLRWYISKAAKQRPDYRR